MKDIIQQAKENAEKWINDPDFDRQFDESMAKAERTIASIYETQKINVQELLEPFDL